MTPEITIEVEGEEITLSLPIGAWAEISKVNPYPEELWNSFVQRMHRLDELQVVIAEALKWGAEKPSMTADQLINAVGLSRAADYAEQVIGASMQDDAPKKGMTAAEFDSVSGNGIGSN